MMQGQSWWSSHLWWLVASLYVLRPPVIMFSISYCLQWCWIPSPWACMTVKAWPHYALQTSRGLPSSVTFFADRSLIFQFHCLVKTFLFQKLFHICKVWMSLLQKKKSSVLKPMADRMPQVENSMLDLRQQVAAKRQTAQIIKNIVWNCLRARCLRCRWNINELSV